MKARHPVPQRKAFSMVEVSLATLVLTLIVIAALEATGSSARFQRSLADTQLADRLAESLLAEVIAQDYAPPSLAAQAAAAAATDRTGFASVDSYSALSESPPTSRTGVTLAGSTWQRTVTVNYVSASNFTTTSATDTGLKRITIRVLRNGATVATRVGFRATD